MDGTTMLTLKQYLLLSRFTANDTARTRMTVISDAFAFIVLFLVLFGLGLDAKMLSRFPEHKLRSIVFNSVHNPVSFHAGELNYSNHIMRLPHLRQIRIFNLYVSLTE